MEKLNTVLRSSSSLWYLRGLEVPADAPGENPDVRPDLWAWPDLRGETADAGFIPNHITYAKSFVFYTTEDRKLRDRLIYSNAPALGKQPARLMQLGQHLTSVSADRTAVYVLDIAERKVHMVTTAPRIERRKLSLDLPKSLKIDETTRICAWGDRQSTQVLIFSPRERGSTLLSQSSGASSLHERSAASLLPPDWSGDVRIGSAVLHHKTLFFSELRTGSIFSVDLTALDDSSTRERAAVRIAGGNGKGLRFGDRSNSQLLTPSSLAVFCFEPVMQEPLEAIFRKPLAAKLLNHRFLVCVDTEAGRVVTVNLQGTNELLPLIGYPRGERPPSDNRNMLTMPANFEMVVGGVGGALLFGNAGNQEWLALVPQLENLTPGIGPGRISASHS